MIELEEREHTEKLRSSLEASQATKDLFSPAATVARYQSPPETTPFPLEYAFHLLGDVRGKTILEYGCGDGLNTVILAKSGAKVIALDISDELLAVAKKRLEVNGCDEVELLIGSAHALPLRDDSVDIIFGMAILHHLDLKIAAPEVSRVLKTGGKAIFEEPVRNSKLLAGIRHIFPKRADVSPFERPLTDEEIKDFAGPYTPRAKPFQLLLSSVASILPFMRRRAIKISAHLDTYLLRQFPSLAYYASVKVFEVIKHDKLVLAFSLYLLLPDFNLWAPDVDVWLPDFA